LDVSFTDLSSGDVSGWLWEFGDGQSSDLQNPTHTYTTVGRYTVSLTITDGRRSDDRVRPAYVQVTLSPTNAAIIDCSTQLVQLCSTVKELYAKTNAFGTCPTYSYTLNIRIEEKESWDATVADLADVVDQLENLEYPTELAQAVDALVSGTKHHQDLLARLHPIRILEGSSGGGLLFLERHCADSTITNSLRSETETDYDQACALWQATLDTNHIPFTDIGLTESLLEVVPSNIDFSG
jgi:PKD repeat protein